MSLLTRMKYSFVSFGAPRDAFTVVSFRGFEAISKPYEFEIVLVSDRRDVDPLNVLKNPANFTIHRDEEDNVDFNGILTQFEETRQFRHYQFFKAVLSPKLKWLSLTHHNQVFLDKAAPKFMEDALKDGGLHPNIDFEFSLQGPQPKVGFEKKDDKGYRVFDYVCQYDESHFNFVSRWAEHEGIYYYFEQASGGEKVIFTDSKIQHSDLPLGKDLVYVPPSGQAFLHTDEFIHSYVCRHNLLPQKVFLKDYNYLKPSLPLQGEAVVDADGRGEDYIYGVHFDTPEEGNRLARIRAEALICRKSVFSGESSVPFIVPGYTFNLTHHYKDAYNRKYLVTDVVHEGHQTGYLKSGLRDAVSLRDEEMLYANSFNTIYADAQFRSEQCTEKPKITGTINAKIDAAGSGVYAELDGHGRYKAKLPFDLSDSPGGKASSWFRMVQPYAGRNKGMHFPLHKGTEVLLTFIDGNPDRPVIAGAVPNPEHPSPVTDGVQTLSIIQSNRDRVDANNAEIDDIKDNFIEFQDQQNKERIKIHSDGDLWFEARNRYGEYTIGGPDSASGADENNKVPNEIQYLWNKFYDTSGGAPTFSPTGMALYDYGGTAAAGTTAAPTDAGAMKTLARKGKVLLSKGDTFNTQDGNIYDFGGYWNYNLGPRYVEDHTKLDATLNDTYDFDLLNTAGPNWNGWRTYSGNDESTKNQFVEAANDWEGEKGDRTAREANWAHGKIRVNKRKGNSYEHIKGNQLKVINGNTQTVVIGGKVVEEKWGSHADEDKGKVKRRWYMSGGGKKWEKKWSKHGTLMVDSYTASWGVAGAQKYKSVYRYGGKSTFEWRFQGEVDFKGKMAAAMKNRLYIGLKSENKIFLGVAETFSLKVAAAANIKVSAGAKLNVSVRGGLTDVTVKTYAGQKADIQTLSGYSVKVKNANLGEGKVENFNGAKIDLALLNAVHLKARGGAYMKLAVEQGQLNAKKDESGGFKILVPGFYYEKKAPVKADMKDVDLDFNGAIKAIM